MTTEDTSKLGLETTTSSPVPRSSQQSFVPGDDEKKLQELIRLGSHFWPKSQTPSQARELLRDYINDLEKYQVSELEIVCRNWRTNAENKKFPMVSELLRDLDRRRREITEQANASDRRPAWSSRPLMWWCIPKDRWGPSWRESEVPSGWMIRDTISGPRREPVRR